MDIWATEEGAKLINNSYNKMKQQLKERKKSLEARIRASLYIVVLENKIEPSIF